MLKQSDVTSAKRFNKIEHFKRKQNRKDIRINERQQRRKDKQAGREMRMNLRTADDRGGKHLGRVLDSTDKAVAETGQTTRVVAENADKIGKGIAAAKSPLGAL